MERHKEAGRRAIEVARETLEEEAATGVEFSLEQLTGGRTAGDLAKTLRQIPGGAAIFAKADMQRAANAEKFIYRTIQATAGPSVGASAAGKRVGGAVDNYIRMLAKNRGKMAEQLYGAADAAAGGKRVMKLTNTLAAMDELIEVRYRS